MNAVELFYLIGFIASAAVGGLFLGKHFGVFWGCIGAVLGLTCWAGILWVIKMIVNKLAELYPGRPTCRHGKCSASDYRFLGMKNGGAELECRCGDKYFSKGNRFMASDEKGVLHSYMRRKHSFAKWEKDDSPES
jgi:hypothetical protein